MKTTFDVRFWKTEVYKGVKTTTFTVRWIVGGRAWKEPFRARALADSFRSELVTAARKGEAFSVDTGRPVSMSRTENEMSWWDFSIAYVDMKWHESAGNSRKGVAETLTNVSMAMLKARPVALADDVIRKALKGWAYNKERRDTVPPPADVVTALKWLRSNTRPVSVLNDPAQMRALMALVSQKLDGEKAAPSTVKRKRAVLFNVVEYAVEKRLLEKNPIPGLKWKVPRAVRAIDKRAVVNPRQAVALLDAVRAQAPSGPRLVAFFATMYYSAARPGEAVNLRKQDVLVPAGKEDSGGELLLSESAPETGASWSTTGRRRDRRQLKHREVGETRPVPCPPQLALLLRQHIDHFGTDSDGFLFRGVRDKGLVSESTYSRAWRQARRDALTDGEFASPLARRAYDLRHAAVSTWLAAGVPPTQVAEWAGHSLDVLFKIYAKSLVGQEEQSRRRVAEAYAVK
ncbi:tyrosine-type recombinase/integrase [Actinoalloteichus sp. GBA129-24]|uniref:tyrosine-type recombinase/integrase n=1 Tax=Actinoalloteichus sp. GBA129-24 TaxID=1612551 RepID=UPI0009504386|nr:tyrosine-type recombinase/integrase [Actinoalloteichus sp. GBA129-24]APU20148.1 phage integrase family protein [Actinoalloteichus sp. GBA129-24]